MKSVSEFKAGTTIVHKHHSLKVYRKWMFLLVMKLPFHGKPDKHVLIDNVTAASYSKYISVSELHFLKP
jgi:hypothetical protein